MKPEAQKILTMIEDLGSLPTSGNTYELTQYLGARDKKDAAALRGLREVAVGFLRGMEGT